MFEGVHLVAQYLRGRYHINPDLISETKITEILKIFDKNGGTITVAEIFEHMSDLYKEDKNFYSEKQTTQTENLSENLNILDSNTSKPFGQYGEVTLNQIGGVLKEKLKDVN
jgi:nucleoside diphosphate kinase